MCFPNYTQSLQDLSTNLHTRMDFIVDSMEEQNETSTATITLTTSRPSSGLNAQAQLEMFLRTFANYRMADAINSYGYITEVVLGTVMNILAMIVMFGLLKVTICNYMAALAIADLSVVLGPGLTRWLQTLSYDSKSLSTSLCRFLNFHSYWSFSLSAWLLVAMTVDRYIAITYPFKAMVWSTPKRARFVIAGLTLIIFILNMHFFFTMGVVERKDIGRQICVVYGSYTQFVDEVWPWIDATVYSFLPFACLLVFNCLIIRSHKRSVKAFAYVRGSVRSDSSDSAAKANRKLTITLLTVSFVFLALTAPRIILIIVRTSVFNFKPTPTTIDFEILANYTLTASIVNILMIGNHCINFVLYVLTGNKFRKQVVFMFKLCLPKTPKHQQVGSVPSSSSETSPHKNVSNRISTATELTEF